MHILNYIIYQIILSTDYELVYIIIIFVTHYETSQYTCSHAIAAPSVGIRSKARHKPLFSYALPKYIVKI